MSPKSKTQNPKSHLGIEPPQLPPRPSASELPGQRLDDMETYTGLLLSGGDLSDQIAEDVTFERTILRQVLLSRTQLQRPQFHDVRLDACDLAGGDWERAQLSRVELIGCRMLGWRAGDASLRHVLIRGCNGTGAQFWAAACKGVRFENCILRDADFQQADLSGVVFERCDLSNAKMSGAKLAGADLRGSTIEGLRLGVKELQGAIVDIDQAISIARMLGIVVKMD